MSILLSTTASLLIWDAEFSISKSLKYFSYDQPFLTRSLEIPDDIVLVYLDDKSHQDLQQPYNRTWDRRWHTELIKRLTREGARAVVFDIIFADPSSRDPAIDTAMAKAIEENGRVVLAAELLKSNLGGQNESQLTEPVLPHIPFDDACAGVGFSSLLPDYDLEVRKHFHYDEGTELLDSLTWGTARALDLEITKDEENRKTPRYVNYYGPPRSLNWYSFSDVVGPDAKKQVLFKDKIVYVGSHLLTYNTGERKDELLNPWSTWDFSGSTWKFIAGAEVHATILLNLLREDWLTEVPKKVQLIYFVVMGIVLGFGLVLIRPLIATLLAATIAIGLTIVAHYLHWHHLLWFPWAITLAVQIPIALAFSVVFNSVRLFVQKQLLEQSIRAYLSPKLVKAFANRPDENFLKPGAKKQELSILFSDIAGFTSLSEGMDSSELADLMNGYFEATVSHGIHATDGTVVKYIGDAIFAFWNAPDPQPDHATRACQAAIQIQAQPYQFSETKPVLTRVGIHTGVANVGNFGSAHRVDYTAIGENINLASRLEGLNKYIGTQILISKETRDAASDEIVTRDLGLFRLKGFEKTVNVVEVLGDTESIRQQSQPLIKTFDSALTLFKNKDFEHATAAFEAILVTDPDDGPSKFYLKQIELLKITPPAADAWNGEVTLEDK